LVKGAKEIFDCWGEAFGLNELLFWFTARAVKFLENYGNGE
jgi:hypothetical protein